MLIHHDNIPAHTSAKLVELGYEMWNWFCFQTWKSHSAGRRLNEEVIAAKEAYFAELEKTSFSDGFKKIEGIELTGDYLEK